MAGQMTASDGKQAAKEQEKVIAFRNYRDLKKQTNKNYALRLRRQYSLEPTGINDGYWPLRRIK